MRLSIILATILSRRLVWLEAASPVEYAEDMENEYLFSLLASKLSASLKDIKIYK